MPTIDSARPYYPENDPVHGFDHIKRVYRLAERLAVEMGADREIVRAAALLHDAVGEAAAGEENPAEAAKPDAVRQEHQHLSAAFAGRVLRAEGWSSERIQAVQHCIRAHRFRDPSRQPESLEAQVLFDADKLDAIGAIGVARALAYAARQGQPLYARPSAAFIHSGRREPGEPHSAYHEYVFKLRKIKERLYTPAGRAIAAERHAYMRAFFERLEEEIAGRK